MGNLIILVETQKSAIVLGAGGFIGSHMVRRLKAEGYWVRGVDLKCPEFSETKADEFIQGDLRNPDFTKDILVFNGFVHCIDDFAIKEQATFDEIYQFAADMGGAGYLFSGENDARVMHNSSLINLNVLQAQHELNESTNINKTKIFYSSSACIYPERNQLEPDNPNCRENSVYPAEPDSEYGWEKLFSERIYLSYNRNYKISVRIARYHNIFGKEGSWEGGREKAPAAICRKVALLPESGGKIEVWGDGEQTRSFLYIDECIEATRRLMQSDFQGPVNIGSEEMVSLNQLVRIVAKISGKAVKKKHKLDAPLGVRGRNSNNDLIREKLGWDYSMTLEEGIQHTYDWIVEQVETKKQVTEVRLRA